MHYSAPASALQCASTAARGGLRDPDRIRRFRRPLRSMRRIVATILVSLAVAAWAQDGRDLTDEARTRYAKALKETMSLVQQRRFDDAKTALDRLIADRPRDPQARFLLGVVQTESGHDDDAVK